MVRVEKQGVILLYDRRVSGRTLIFRTCRGELLAAIHPLLRVASSALILVDPASVITDAARTAEDYWLMGLAPNEASLHFEQEDGFVHALDLRTIGRAEWRNRAVEMAFWALGFHSLRHVGTADHLHVSLRLPA